MAEKTVANKELPSKDINKVSPGLKEHIAPLTKEPETVLGYHPTEENELKVFDQFHRRKLELFNSRSNVLGLNIDAEMRKWDKNYFYREADIPASELDPDQRPVSICNAFGKVQSALGIMIDRNPEISLDESNPRYSANRQLMKGLAQASWKNTNSLGQFKLSIFNCAKRGWFVGRTFNRVLRHKARFLNEVDEKGNKNYREAVITKMDDVAYMNMNNFNTWIDEQTYPDDFFSTRDWMWREIWHIDDLRRMFPQDEFPNMQYVKSGGDTSEVRGGLSTIAPSIASVGNTSKQTKKGMTEVFFYENQYDDWFIVEINGVMVVWEPLPQNSKRLSIVYGYWTLRSAETMYGIGIVEMMERNESLLDRIMNMNMRQLLLTIAPPGFYTGSEDPEDENLKYKPGTLRRTLDPKSISWLEIPEGNQGAYAAMEYLENKEDQMTGVSGTLEGEVSSEGEDPTAFEIGVNREAALKRLRIPLKSFQTALSWEFNNRVELIKQVYSDFQVEHLSSKDDIFAYLDEVKADPKFYFIENEDKPGEEKFYAKRYREMQLNVDQDAKGNYIASESKSFFKITPEMLVWSGDVTVDIGSILVQSEELEQADVLRLANIVVPMLAQDPNVVGKPLKRILIAFNRDPMEWLPDSFLKVMMGKDYKAPAGQGQSKGQGAGGGQGLPNQNAGQGAAATAGGNLAAPTLVPANTLQSKTTVASRMAGAIKGFKNPTNSQVTTTQ